MKTARPLLLLAFVAGCTSQEDSPVAKPSPASSGPPSTTAAAVAVKPDAEGFVPIDVDFNNQFAVADGGKRSLLTGVDVERAADTFDVTLRMYGTTRGYLYTNRTYRDFTLRFDYRWPNAADLPDEERPNANTGVLVFITGEHKVWPKCLEVQGKWSEMGHIKSNAKEVTVTVHDNEEAREEARKPVGEWNAVEVVAKDGAIVSYVNGVKIAESDPTELVEGPIGFQAERFDVEFRNVRVRAE